MWMVQAADVYAFGVLLWELFHGVRAWDGLNHAQVGAASLPVLGPALPMVVRPLAPPPVTDCAHMCTPAVRLSSRLSNALLSGLQHWSLAWRLLPIV